MSENSTFYTIGHSTRSVAELVDLLKEAGVNFVVDVRTIPRSLTNPQFNVERLPEALANNQIGYRHVARLGGLRGREKDKGSSPNTFWKNVSFRNYADYASTASFRDGLAELCELGSDHVCVIMCAEAVWWRCHRRIIADYLLANDRKVFHILGRGKFERAVISTEAAKQSDGTLLYVSGRA